MPSLIASQILPLMFPGGTGTGGNGGNVPTANRVTVLAPGLSASSPTPQQITLTDTISGAPTGGTVTFTVAGVGTVKNVPVVNGVARVVFTIPVGTPDTAGGKVTATYSGTTGFGGSTSMGGGSGTLAFCQDGASTLLGTTLQSFAVLAGSAVTNTGPTVIVGNVGVSTGSSISGFTGPPNGTVTGGTTHSNDATAIQAQSDLVNAITTISGAPPTRVLTGKDLGGLTLTPGIYFFASSAQLTGTLTLNDENNPTALFEFQIGSTLTTASGARVQFINGGADNVYWEVGSSATLGSSTVFAGNILANTSITLDSTASIACGRALAHTGAVTLIDNFIDPAPPGPRVVVPATASATLVTGTTTRLSVRGFDSTGAASLRYTWSTVSTPAAVARPTFIVNGTHGARNTTVTFHAAGTYTFRVTITDKNGLSTTSDVTVMVEQSLKSIQVMPSTTTVDRSQADPLAARAFDQFGAALLIQPIFSWSMAGGSGSVSSTGLYTAPRQQPGTAIIRARSGKVSGTASVTTI